MKKLKLLVQPPEGWELGTAVDDAGAPADSTSPEGNSDAAGNSMIVIDDGASLNDDPFVILPPEDDMMIVIDDGAFLGAYLDENGNVVVPDNGRMMDGWDNGNWCVLPIWDGEDFVIDEPVVWIEEPADGGESDAGAGDEAGAEVPGSGDDMLIVIDDGAALDKRWITVDQPEDGSVVDGEEGGWWCALPVWEGGEDFPVDGPADGGEDVAALPDGSEDVADLPDGGDAGPVICICYPPEFFVV